jgi:acetolactate synthase-1/2/3 large subunit
VPGPGFLNTGAALSTAYAGGAPVLAIVGQIATANIGRGIGVLHEIPDQLAIIRGLTKWAARIEYPTQMEHYVDEAFRQLQTGRVRPVGLEIPSDVLALETEIPLNGKAPAPAPQAADPQLIEKAAALLGKAERPLIMVGSGANDAGPELLAIAEMLQAPVAAVASGKGIVSDRHYLAQVAPAAYQLWAKADVVLAIGTRLQRPLSMWGTDDTMKIIRVDLDPSEMGRVYPPAVAIHADAKAATAALLEALPKYNKKRESREAELSALKESVRQQVAATVQPQYDFLQAIRAELPDEGILVDEVTQVGYASNYGYPVYKPRTTVSSGYQGTLGFGFATALGVKVAHPDTPVVSISGDGGFMYNVQELSTAVLHNIALVTVVFTDGAFGNVLRMQRENYGGKVIASKLHNPDFVKLAENFGAVGVRAHGPEELRVAIREGLTRDGPTLIEVPVGEMADPWKLFFFPRARGK